MTQYRGALSGYTAVDLAALTLKGTLEKYQIASSSVQELFLGNVYAAGLGQSPAKQVAVKAGLPDSTICTNLNKVCSSGMVALTSAFMTIKQGIQDVVVAGGVDIMSNVPHYMARNSTTKGDTNLVDGMIKDGLWDSRYNVHMGECAERCADKYSISRQDMDTFAVNSNTKAVQAWANGKFNNEVIPLKDPKNPAVTISKDSIKGPSQKFTEMRPAFRKEKGKVTAGNASPLSDGSAMLVLASRAKASEMGWKVLATIETFANAEQNNIEFTTSPNLAVRIAAERAGLDLQKVDYFELNEAFAVVGIANTQLLGIDANKVNVYGGAVALGHPLGCSGARIVVTLINVLKQEGGKVGIAGICNGGGGATAVVVRVE
jgi:acetyl-CoA C-acetyltransferase